MHEHDTGAETGAEGEELKLSRAASRRRGLQLYFSLIATQTLGIAIILVNILPLYRMMTLDFRNFTPDDRPWWAYTGVIVVLAAYSLRVRLQPPLPRTESTLLGHLLLFIAKMFFVVATAGFATMFLNRIEDLREIDYPVWRALLVLMIFFAMFCWTLELERLGRALQRNKS